MAQAYFHEHRLTLALNITVHIHIAHIIDPFTLKIFQFHHEQIQHLLMINA